MLRSEAGAIGSSQPKKLQFKKTELFGYSFQQTQITIGL